MAATVIVRCKNCNDPFSARTADRARGWARFCSKSCKAAEQERRTGQNARYHARREAAASDYYEPPEWKGNDE